jgi:hypothetical protein
MYRETILMVLGGLIVISHYVGLPGSILSYILPLLGVGVLVIAYTLRLKRVAIGKTMNTEERIAENEHLKIRPMV